MTTTLPPSIIRDASLEGRHDGSRMIPEGGKGNPLPIPQPTPPPGPRTDDGCRIVSSADLLKRCQASLGDPTSGQLWGLNIRAGTVSLFVGETSVGKTVFLHNLAYQLATGREFLGLTPPRPLRVLCLDFESYEEIYAEHLTAIGTADGWDFFDLEGITPGSPLLAHLKKVVSEERYDVVIIDPLMEAYPVKDENDNAFANTQMLAFRDLARSTNTAVVVVHNSGLRKGKRNPKFLGRGATARVDRADVAINFTWKSKTERILSVVKARGANLDESMTLRFADEFGYELVESSSPNPSVIATLQAETLGLVRQEAAQGISELDRKTMMQQLNIEKGSAREQALDRALSRNAAAGVLGKVRKGVYRLPSESPVPTSAITAEERASERSSFGEPEARSESQPVAVTRA